MNDIKLTSILNDVLPGELVQRIVVHPAVAEALFGKTWNQPQKVTVFGNEVECHPAQFIGNALVLTSEDMPLDRVRVEYYPSGSRTYAYTPPA